VRGSVLLPPLDLSGHPPLHPLRHLASPCRPHDV